MSGGRCAYIGRAPFRMPIRMDVIALAFEPVEIEK
jgi:hypothetical protein